jgi:hypothetical protein
MVPMNRTFSLQEALQSEIGFVLASDRHLLNSYGICHLDIRERHRYNEMACRFGSISASRISKCTVQVEIVALFSTKNNHFSYAYDRCVITQHLDAATSVIILISIQKNSDAAVFILVRMQKTRFRICCLVWMD